MVTKTRMSAPNVLETTTVIGSPAKNPQLKGAILDSAFIIKSPTDVHTASTAAHPQ